MSLFDKPLLKQEPVEFSGFHFELYELSAYDRCEFLEKTTGHIAAPKEGEVAEVEFDNLGQMWALHREDVSSKLLLVAYALKPGREESLEDLHRELRECVPPEQIDELYVPAAKLSGLYVEPPAGNDKEKGNGDGAEGSEGAEKKG
ncbi:hypothetical protein [Microbulbifer sp. JSM ZJ756]|uniref:hypothetical protein n=1 Tax=Microbulbifer sp. JSM ZJ756 TaxID=3376191 RepID=UPI0037A0E5D8